MSALVLVAASGLARETLEAVRAGGHHHVIGVVDDDRARWGGDLAGVPVLGGLDAVADHPEAEIVLCAGKGAVRAELAERLAVEESRFATVIHPSVDVPVSCAVGAGSIVLAGAVLTASVTLGRHVVVMPHVTLTHDDVVDDYATLCAAVAVGGGVRVGPRAYVGMNAAIRERITVAADSTIGMGAVLLQDTGPGETWAGCPARPLRPRPMSAVS